MEFYRVDIEISDTNCNARYSYLRVIKKKFRYLIYILYMLTNDMNNVARLNYIN